MKLREALLMHKDILLKLEQLERKVIQHDDEVKVIFECLKELLEPPAAPISRIRFKRNGEE